VEVTSTVGVDVDVSTASAPLRRKENMRTG